MFEKKACAKIDTMLQRKRDCALLVCPTITQQRIVQEKRNVELRTVRRLTKDSCITGRNLTFHQSVNSASTNLTINSESVRDLMQVARVKIFGQDGQFEDTLAACDTDSTQTWVDEDILDRLQLEVDKFL